MIINVAIFISIVKNCLKLKVYPFKAYVSLRQKKCLARFGIGQ